MRIFLIVYINKYSKSYYEHIYNTFVLLEHSRYSLQLHKISACKIICSVENFDFNKIVKMIDYIFLYIDIRIQI